MFENGYLGDESQLHKIGVFQNEVWIFCGKNSNFSLFLKDHLGPL